MRIIDLSQTIRNDMPVFPGTVAPHLETANTLEADGFKETSLHLLSHTGTHLDAPSHMLADGQNLEDFELAQYCGKALVLDCRTCYGGISTDFLKSHAPKIANIEFVLLWTGHSEQWGHPGYYEDFATPTPAAAAYLASFALKGIGIDAISFDRLADAHNPSHRPLLAKGLILIENLCNLEQINQENCYFLAFPLKYRQADGSPVRAVAIVES